MFLFLLFQDGKRNVIQLCENSTISTNEKGLKDLLVAVKNNRPQMMVMLLSKGTDINMRTDLGDSLLHVSVMCGSDEATRTLLKLGLDPNIEGYEGFTPIYRAAEMNDVESMKELVEKGAVIDGRFGLANDSLLHLACEKGHEEVATWLLDSGLDPDSRNDNRYVTPLQVCAKEKRLNISKLLIRHNANVKARDSEGHTPLHYAGIGGDLELVKFLVEKGANVRATSNVGLTPLHTAADGKHPEVMLELVKEGADVTAMQTYTSPLHQAVFSLQTLQAMLDSGADVNLRNNEGETPLHWASSTTGQPLVVEELIARGGNVNAQNRNGRTPLHVASSYSNREVAEVLIASGANLNAVDVNGRTPLHLAASRDDEDFIKMLLSKGAKCGMEDGEGETPLTWAINTGNLRVVENLRLHCPPTE